MSKEDYEATAPEADDCHLRLTIDYGWRYWGDHLMNRLTVGLHSRYVQTTEALLQDGSVYIEGRVMATTELNYWAGLGPIWQSSHPYFPPILAIFKIGGSVL